MFIKIFDRYIGKQVLATTAFAVLVLSVVLVLANVFKKLLAKLADHPDLNVGFIFEFILNVMPYSLIFTVPWGLLTAILLTFGRLSADNELTALRMAGQSMWRICAPVFLLAMLMTGFCMWMNVDVSPKSQARIHKIFFELATSNPAALFTRDEVVTTIPGQVIYVEDIIFPEEEGDPYQLVNMNLVRLTNRDRPDLFVKAELATMGFRGENQDQLFFELEGSHFEKNSGIESTDFGNIQIINASNSTVMFPLDELKEKHRKERPSYLTVRELRAEIQKTEDEEFRSTLRTELHKRFSLSLACITFCFTAIPLGVTAQRRETSVGFALSMIIAIAYFLFIVVAEMFHENPSAYPHLLIWLPNVIFMSLGGYLFYRLSQR